MREFGTLEGKSVLRCRQFYRPRSSKRRRNAYLQDDGLVSKRSRSSKRSRNDDELVTEIRSSKHLKKSSSSNSLPYLPNELVTEILEWLPIKSIVRFRLVCRLWSALFKNQTFITNHRLKQVRTKSGTMLLLRRRYAPPDSNHDVLSFHDLDSPELEVRDPIPIRIRVRNLVGYETMQFTIQGPINGVICIFTAWRFILCNPALHEFKLLPNTPWDASPIGYDRYSCEAAFGVSSSGDFKVIVSYRFINMMNRSLLPDSLVAHLYNSRTNSWTRFDDAPLWPDHPPSQANAILLNGAWHWPGRTFSSDRQTIVSCDVTSEVFGQLELPDCLAGFNEGCSRTVVLNDCLGVLHHQQRPMDSKPIEVWVMKEYGVKESWDKLFVISPQQFVFTFLPWKNDTMFLLQTPRNYSWRRSRSGEFDSNFNDQLTSINLRTSEVKKFQVFGAERTIRGLIYEESLVSLN